MSKTITIDPVTRIEGHSKITIHLDEAGHVSDARFHVTQFRGFEKICEGRPFSEMPSLMARTCGICPVSHLIASAKACDALLAVRIPETAETLRRVINLAQILQSHALSFFYLSSADLLLGMDADPATRNLVGVLAAEPEFARRGIRLRQFGQQIIERLAGKRIHPAWVVPGGVSAPLDETTRDWILSSLPEMQRLVEEALADQEWAEFRDLERGSVLSSFHYHYARLIEMLHCVERLGELLEPPECLGRQVRAHAQPNAREGIGVAEAPRGTLIHHYRIDEHGLVTWANLIIATGHNSLAMNRGVLQVARHFVDGRKIQEGALNRVEAVIRAYDPCLSCSTHAVGQMPLTLQLVAADGALVDEVGRAS